MEENDAWICEKINEDLTFTHRRGGLTFGTDAYLLAAFVRAIPNATLLDLGSGTGIIPLLLLAKNKIRRALGVEIQAPFADLITKNAADNGYSDRLKAHLGDIRAFKPGALSTYFSEIGEGGADIVTANPPYMRIQAGERNANDELYIARHEVCGNIGDFCAAAARLLRFGGSFYTVWRPDRTSELFAALHENHLEPKRMVFVQADAETAPSSLLVESRLGGGVELHTLPALLLHTVESRHDRVRPFTPRTAKIYDTLSFEGEKENN